jgi:hypothetical protein
MKSKIVSIQKVNNSYEAWEDSWQEEDDEKFRKVPISFIVFCEVCEPTKEGNLETKLKQFYIRTEDSYYTSKKSVDELLRPFDHDDVGNFTNIMSGRLDHIMIDRDKVPGITFEQMNAWQMEVMAPYL